MPDNPSSDWYREFFTELPNEVWRRVMPAGAATGEVDFVERSFGLVAGARIADVPCGSGRHTLAFAERGHQVTGLDISAEAIAHARLAAEEAGLEVGLFVAEMREIADHGPFDVAVCLGNSFGYLDLDGTRDFVLALAKAVRPGGGLVVDFNSAAESLLPGYTGEPRTMRAGDITVSVTTTYDVAGSRALSRNTFRRGDEEVTVTAVHHVYTTAHLGHLLSEAGFTDLHWYSGPDGKPYELGSGRLLLTAVRAHPEQS